MADYAEHYADFKRAGAEVIAVSRESRRKTRRLRTTLRLPFTVLSDARLEMARSFGLMGHEKSGLPTPATIVLDGQGRTVLSSLNQGARPTKSLVARDMLDYVSALRRAHPADTTAIPAPRHEQPRPGWLFVRALANAVIGLIRG